MTILKVFISFLCVMSLFGCVRQNAPVKTNEELNETTTFLKLGTNSDGCTVTKFIHLYLNGTRYEEGYYTYCKSDSQPVTSFVEGCGRNCRRTVDVKTSE
jgi:hypothetical protein